MDLQLFVIAITPGIALGLAIYLSDRYDKEPIDLLSKIFILGAVFVIPTAIVEYTLMRFNVFGGLLGVAYISFIVAGLTEEFFKRYVVLKFAFNNSAFNEKLDGIVYSVFAALGFATVENIIYVVFRFAANPYVGIYRGLLSVPAHCLFAVTMGYYLSLAKYTYDPNLKRIYLRRSLVIPAFLHGIFDFILMSGFSSGMFFIIGFVIYLWIVNLRRLNEYYQESKSRFK